ncbi:fimbria/pilus periplasmic chaperone [Burkholderia sp. Ac-20353]|nr:fimbria/pilus periplasmic chaperone [Burkholderia sp. Ac-20353]MBN3790745.1 fimbria/pilus periplasmic chaperone [Burkholderia sp. Ac-20353]
MTTSRRLLGLVATACIVAWVACASPAQAALVLQGTRVVFPEQARDVTLRVENTGDQPVLAQSWIDDGRVDVPPEKLQVPFIVAPSVARIEPAKSLALRITHTQEPLPEDRESVFWLNVLEVPTVGAEEENRLRFAFRTRIKLFYRPTALREGADLASDQLAWKLAPAEPSANGRHGGSVGVALEVSNPTPYYISFGRVESDIGGPYVSGGGGMVAPFGTARFPLPGVTARTRRHASVRFMTIDDFGGRTTTTRTLAD